MSKHPIDELFRKRFTGREEPYPEHVWERVKKELHGVPEKSRRGAFWWIPWASVAALLIVAGVLMYQYSDSEGTAGTELSMIQTEQGRKYPTTADGDSNQYSEESPGMSTTNSDDSPSLSEVKGDESDRENKADADPTGNANSSSSALYGNIQDRNSEIQAKEGQYVNEKRAPQTTSDDTGFRSSASQEFLKTTSGTQGSGQSSNTANSNQSVQNAASTSTDVLNNQLKSETDIHASTGLSTERVNDILSETPVYYENEVLSSTSNAHRSIRPYLPVIPTYGQNAIRLKWSIAPVYGYDFVQRSILSRNADGQALALYRREHERIVNAFTIGAEIGIKWHAWTLYTGLHYSQINDRYDYTVDNVVRDVVGGPVNGVIERSIVNRYSSLEIPILAEYGWGHKNWRMGAIIGIQAGVSFDATGEVFDDATLQAVDMSDQDIYRSNLGIVPVIGMSLGYKIGYNSLLFVRPSFKYYRGSITRGDYGVEQRLTTTSFLFGMRYNLN